MGPMVNSMVPWCCAWCCIWCGQVFITMGKLKNTLDTKPWEEVTMELLKLCVPRAVNGIEQEWPFQSVREDLAKILLAPMGNSVIYNLQPETHAGKGMKATTKRKKKAAADDLEEPSALTSPDRTWLEDVLAMSHAVLGQLPEARVHTHFKLDVLRKCLCFALTRSITVGGKHISKWSKLRKEMKATLFREHRAVILSQPDMPKKGAKRKATATKDAEEPAAAPSSSSEPFTWGAKASSGCLAGRVLGEENLKARILDAERCCIEDADKQLISAFLVSNPPKKNIKLHPMRMQLMEAALQETGGKGQGYWLGGVIHTPIHNYGASNHESCKKGLIPSGCAPLLQYILHARPNGLCKLLPFM